MSKYFKYTPSSNQHTTLRFNNNGTHDDLEIKEFDTHVVAISGMAADITTLIDQQPTEIGFTEIDFDAFFKEAVKSSEARFHFKQLDENLEKQMRALSGDASDAEIKTWAKQEAEARALKLDAATATPYLDKAVISRGEGETRSVLADKIIINADALAGISGEIVGAYQKAKKDFLRLL